jgi:hypothetical protein
MGMGDGGMGGEESKRFRKGWKLRYKIDNEEIFRKIFGDDGLRRGGFGYEFEDFEE